MLPNNQRTRLVVFDFLSYMYNWTTVCTPVYPKANSTVVHSKPCCLPQSFWKMTGLKPGPCLPAHHVLVYTIALYVGPVAKWISIQLITGQCSKTCNPYFFLLETNPSEHLYSKNIFEYSLVFVKIFWKNQKSLKTLNPGTRNNIRKYFCLAIMGLGVDSKILWPFNLFSFAFDNILLNLLERPIALQYIS